MGGRSKLDFESNSVSGLKTVQEVVPVQVVLAAGITDGEGKKSNRLMIKFAGQKQFYFLFPKGTEESMKPAAGWLQDILEREVGSDSNNDQIPDLITDVPVGDPLEA